MRKIIDGEEYVMGKEALEIFACYWQDLKDWRENGMPCKEITGLTKWAYPIDRCQAWFRGENENDGVVTK